MKTLDRYIIKTFVGAALLFFVSMMSLRIVTDLFVNIDEFAERAETFAGVADAAAKYYGYHSFEYFGQLGGVIIVASAAFSVARMNHTNELTAMLASGVSLYRVVWPIILCSMLLGGLIILDQEIIIPSIADKLILERDEPEEGSSKAFSVPLAGDSQRTVWYSPRLDSGLARMDKPLFLVRDKHYALLGAGYSQQRGIAVDERFAGLPGWVASKAKLSRAGRAGRAWDDIPSTDIIYTTVGMRELLKVAKAARLKRDPTAAIPPDEELRAVTDLPPVGDRRYDMVIQAQKMELSAPQPGRQRRCVLLQPRFTFYVGTEANGRRMLGMFLADSAEWMGDPKIEKGHWKLDKGVLFCPSDLTVEELIKQQSDKWMEYMSSAQLGDLLDSGRAGDPDMALTTKFVRIADPINNLVMLLLGLPFILSRERNIKASAGLCLLMVGAFYAFIYICRYMGLQPWWAAFLPIMLFGPVSVVMLDSVKT